MTGLLDPTLDYIFKTIFGQEDRKHLLISFLNALLKGQPQIKDITLENTELAKILETDKASRLDIKATTGDGTKLDIEIQCKNTGEIPERAIYYTCKMVAGQKLAGSPYVDQKAISIWILGENVTSLEDPVNEAGLMYKPKRAHPLDMSDSIRIVFIELQKFDPKNADAKDMLTAWLSFLKDPVYMDKAFLDIDEVSTAMDTLKYISADDDVRAIADLRQKTISDYNSGLTVAREEGIEEGMAIGEAKGIAFGIEQTAIAMLANGIPPETVSKCTNLPIEKVQLLQKNNLKIEAL